MAAVALAVGFGIQFDQFSGKKLRNRLLNSGAIGGENLDAGPFDGSNRVSAHALAGHRRNGLTGKFQWVEKSVT